MQLNTYLLKNNYTDSLKSGPICWEKSRTLEMTEPFHFWSRKSEVGTQKSELGTQKSEVRSQKSEVGSRKSEVGSQKSDVRSRESEVGSPSSAFVDLSSVCSCKSYSVSSGEVWQNLNRMEDNGL